MRLRTLVVLAFGTGLASTAALAAPFFFSTGNPDGLMATGSRPSAAGQLEIESADDFILGATTSISQATFTGIVTGANASLGAVSVEIYRVFPLDSDVGRTSGPPTFSTTQVPTRVNSPSDVAFVSADSTSGLSLVTSTLSPAFAAANSVLNGINPKPGQTTGGEGPVTGREVLFTVTLTSPFVLDAGHYFFIPQVAVTGGSFYWLSAPRPISGGTGPFAPDLQSWIRNENLAPDWLRVGTDIVGAGAFNETFSLAGETAAPIPEPETWALMLAGLALTGGLARRARRRGART